MKTLTIQFPDDATIDISSLAPLIALATSFSITSDPKPAPSKPQKSYNKVGGGRTALDLIMDHHTPSGAFSLRNAEEWLMKAGLSQSGASSHVHKLVRLGYLDKIGTNRFTFVKAAPEEGFKNYSKKGTDK